MKNFSLIPALYLSLMLTSAARADDKPSVDITRSQREEMAAMHDKVSSCLRSNKSMQECHAEMKSSCHQMMNQGQCPMMGAGANMMKQHRVKQAEEKQKTMSDEKNK